MSIDLIIALIEVLRDPVYWKGFACSFIAGFCFGAIVKGGVDYLRFRSEEREKQYQRKRQEQLEAEQRTQAEAAAAAEAARKKAIAAIREKFVYLPNGRMLVSKDKSDPRRYCIHCCEHNGTLSALDEVSSGKFHCPSCGWRSWPKRYTANGIE